MMEHDWLKIKKYPHIGLPIEPSHKRKVISYVTNSANIAKHSFDPLIRKQVKSFRCSIDEEHKEKIFKKKIRNLTYSSHLDSAIFAYYGYILQERYEHYLQEHQIENIPTAYRRIPCDAKHPERGNKCNIEIAKEVFDFIKSEIESGHDASIITFDIKGFFDNLDHRILKRLWKKILGIEGEMPKDIYQVFKHVTKFTYIHEEQLFNLFKEEILCKRNDGVVIKRRIKRKAYLRGRNAIAFCERKDIKKIREAHILRTSPKNSKGIPQGLPISATLANVYMCEFDETINTEIQRNNGLYRRYSDDIIIVCPIEKTRIIKEFILEQIRCIELEIEENKTNIFSIKHNAEAPIFEIHKDNKKKELEYLGFSFDGSRTLIKKASIAKHYRKMNKAHKRHLWYAIHINNKTAGSIFENQLIKHFSLRGARRHRIRKRDPKNHSKFEVCKNKGKTFGNYLTYAYKAALVMNEDKIKKQLKRNLHRLITKNQEIKALAIKQTSKKRK